MKRALTAVLVAPFAVLAAAVVAAFVFERKLDELRATALRNFRPW